MSVYESIQDEQARDPVLASSGPWNATVAADVTALTELAAVTIPRISATLRIVGVKWQPRPSALSVTDPATRAALAAATTLAELQTALLTALDDLLMPKRGDACLVIFDDTGQPWITNWEPS